MKFKTRLTMWVTWVSVLIALVGLLAARIDRRIDRAEAQAKKDAAQDARLDAQERQIVAIGKYMAWSASMLVGIAAQVGATMSEAPPVPTADHAQPAPTHGPQGR